MQNKNFYIQLMYWVFQDFINPTHGIFIFYYYSHMKMKKILLGAFLGMFALAGVAILPNQTLAQNVNQITFLLWDTIFAFHAMIQHME